ncbi:MAG: hypothetical protein R6V72_06900 [Cyclobacterium sp.]|uniref:hypothetical protein n=1 Tax=unclassified Cyclobacterium TaxID=2615055 RepID=UPI001969EAFC|nr:hypothetical protein [Cyclobacterium sp. SYSU L10401]
MDRKCPECGDVIHGREDKIFCSDQCRFQRHNRNKRRSEKTILDINKILRKNRRILQNLNPIGLTAVRREILTRQGFDFNFFTHQYITQKGNYYYFCYEYGYAYAEKEKINVVTWQEYMNQQLVRYQITTVDPETNRP